MAVIATGFFDGVHLGHRLVVDTLLSEAAKRGERSVILTFWPHPRTVLQNDARQLRLLSSQEEKIGLLRSLGVDTVEVLPFTKEFASNSARQYIEDVLPTFGCSELVLGYDTRMGADQIGPSELHRIFPESVVVPPYLEAEAPVWMFPDNLGEEGALSSDSGAVISSTRIRKCLEAGSVASAARMIGRPYELHGVVVSGNQLGRTIGFPTANMQVYDPLKTVPARGAYLVEIRTLGSIFYGMTNIGVRPTVSSSAVPTIETNIFDFDEMIYGLDLTIRFLSRIRDEMTFPSVDELKTQLTQDREICLSALNTTIYSQASRRS